MNDTEIIQKFNKEEIDLPMHGYVIGESTLSYWLSKAYEAQHRGRYSKYHEGYADGIISILLDLRTTNELRRCAAPDCRKEFVPIPGQIVFNALYFFTQPGDLVIDPMAGGGTVIDACLLMNRKCYAYDLEPSRDDILKHDIEQSLDVSVN